MSDKMAKRILIIDDDEAYCSMIKIRLESIGYETYTAHDGLDGFNLAKREMPDLILLDLMLPSMDGHKICRLIKFDKRFKNIPVIMLTSRDLEKDCDIAKRNGADAFIVKTTKSKILLDVIRQLLVNK